MPKEQIGRRCVSLVARARRRFVSASLGILCVLARSCHYVTFPTVEFSSCRFRNKNTVILRHSWDSKFDLPTLKFPSDNVSQIVLRVPLPEVISTADFITWPWKAEELMHMDAFFLHSQWERHGICYRGYFLELVSVNSEHTRGSNVNRVAEDVPFLFWL